MSALQRQLQSLFAMAACCSKSLVLASHETCVTGADQKQVAATGRIDMSTRVGLETTRRRHFFVQDHMIQTLCGSEVFRFVEKLKG